MSNLSVIPSEEHRQLLVEIVTKSRAEMSALIDYSHPPAKEHLEGTLFVGFSLTGEKIYRGILSLNHTQYPNAYGVVDAPIVQDGDRLEWNPILGPNKINTINETGIAHLSGEALEIPFQREEKLVQYLGQPVFFLQNSVYAPTAVLTIGREWSEPGVSRVRKLFQKQLQ